MQIYCSYVESVKVLGASKQILVSDVKGERDSAHEIILIFITVAITDTKKKYMIIFQVMKRMNCACIFSSVTLWINIIMKLRIIIPKQFGAP